MNVIEISKNKRIYDASEILWKNKNNFVQRKFIENEPIWNFPFLRTKLVFL